jgi:hypothetical protein
VAEQPAAGPPQWLTHRDEAVRAANAGQRDVAYREIESALKNDPIAAAGDAALAGAAVSAIDPKQVSFVVETFRSNPQLLPALANATAQGETAEQRHAALDGLKLLGQDAQADLIAMRILDVKQSTTCSTMREAMKQLSGKDPRITAFKAEVRARGKHDPQVRCLKKMVRR